LRTKKKKVCFGWIRKITTVEDQKENKSIVVTTIGDEKRDEWLLMGLIKRE
jgi:hypothetical protein